jgi:RNA polymerase sigma factor for flagellar operon FliA
LRSLDPVSRTTRERINRGVEQERTTFSLDAIVGYRDQALCSQIVIQKQRHNHIADAVDLFAGLSQRERLIVLLYYGEELTQAEVAESLGISPARVAQQMQQIREGIRCRVQAAA